MRETFIVDLKPGDAVQNYFLAAGKKLGKTKGNKPYLDLDLRDKTGSINGKVWENARSKGEKFSRGDVVKILADVTEYRGSKQLTVDRIRKASDDEYDIIDIFPSSSSDPDKMFDKMSEWIESVEKDPLRELLEKIFGKEEFVEKFKRSPGAESVHHSYLGGLIEHTLSVIKICDFLADHYENLDRSLLLTGAILHDIGKMREIENFSYTMEGELIGHITLAAVELGNLIEGIEGFSEELKTELIHLVLSHQGEREWGSPVVPKTREAVILHHADNLDAKHQICTEAIDKEAEDDSKFTVGRNPMRRNFLKN